jgi:hypothetical protein
MSIQDTEAVRVPPGHRAEILRYAGCLLDRRDRDSGRVMETAAPLLEWAQRATGRGDLECRMAAMDRAHTNSQGRLMNAPASEPRPKRLTPAEFLAEAGTYYGFITEAAA